MKTYKLDGEIASFDFHDASGFWSFCGPKSLKAFLADLKAGEKATIEINSPGGSVISGVEMANAIKNSNAHLIAHVTGMAASMASVIACACDEIVMEEASFMMIHDPWSYTEGNAAEMRKQADLLDQMKVVIMSFYRGKFDRTEDELSALMSDETWYTGAECLENGLKCTVVKSDVKIAAKVGAHQFAKMPDAAKALYNFSEMPDDVRAAVDAAAAEAEKTNSEPTGQAGGDAPEPAATGAAAGGEPAAGGAAPSDDWEARYKGASKKINALKDELAAANAELEALKASAGKSGEAYAALETRATELKAENDNLKNQLENLQKDLADASAKVSGLQGDLEKSKADLAACRERAEQLEKTRDLLTGGVLSVTEGQDYAAKMAAAKTPEEREALRAQKKAGKIN